MSAAARDGARARFATAPAESARDLAERRERGASSELALSLARSLSLSLLSRGRGACVVAHGAPSLSLFLSLCSLFCIPGEMTRYAAGSS